MTNAENSISMNRKGVLRFQTRRLKTVESCASESPKSAGPRDGNSIRVQRTQQQRCSHDSNAINGVREHCSLSREAPRSKHGRQAHLSKSDATVSYSLPPPCTTRPCVFSMSIPSTHQRCGGSRTMGTRWWWDRVWLLRCGQQGNEASRVCVRSRHLDILINGPLTTRRL